MLQEIIINYYIHDGNLNSFNAENIKRENLEAQETFSTIIRELFFEPLFFPRPHFRDIIE